MNVKDFTNSEIESKLQHYCSYQERCHKEVFEKLKTFNIKYHEINQIISNLISDNYLNESRFAQSFVRGKFNIKNWGKIRITNELKKRNISSYNIKLGLKELDEQDYLNKFEAIFKKKMSSLKESSIQTKKKKIVSYLLYRGWENHLIFTKINEI